jgi:hypothetical protein
MIHYMYFFTLWCLSLLRCWQPPPMLPSSVCWFQHPVKRCYFRNVYLWFIFVHDMCQLELLIIRLRRRKRRRSRRSEGNDDERKHEISYCNKFLSWRRPLCILYYLSILKSSNVWAPLLRQDLATIKCVCGFKNEKLSNRFLRKRSAHLAYCRENIDQSPHVSVTFVFGAVSFFATIVPMNKLYQLDWNVKFHRWMVEIPIVL